MTRPLLILLLSTLMSITTNAQKSYTVSQDTETGSPVFRGPLSMADLKAEPAFSWMGREAAYTPDADAIGFLRAELPACRLVAVMGTWCDDSHNLIPKLSRVLDAAAFPMEQLRMIGVDRSKQIEGPEGKTLNVTRVPTIIVYQNEKEIGRIVEAVRKSIEADLQQIIRAQR